MMKNKIFSSLDKNLVKNLETSSKIRMQLKGIFNTNDFSVGIIKNKRLQIFASQYLIGRLRRYENQATFILGTIYNFDAIEWKTADTIDITTSKQANKISRIKPRKNQFSNVAKRCKHKNLQKALYKLSTTLQDHNK